MNTKVIRFVFSRMLLVEAALIMLPVFVSLYHKEHMEKGFLVTAAILIFLSLLCGTRKPENMKFYAREGIIIVAGTWILWSFFGAIPFYINGAIPSFIDCLFEMVSGFTTTGASILDHVEGLTDAHLFWRSFSHWIGGMGVLVFVMAILPMAENSSMHIMRAEMAGPRVGKMVPKIASMAKILYGIYISMTIVLIILLLLGRMPLFDSVLHAFATAGTGGFGIKDSSVAYYDSAYLEGVLSVFMILFGVNFNLFYFLLIRRFTSFFGNGELKAYIGIIAVAIAGITINITNMYGSPLTAFRHASFQVSSVITTSGFSSVDFNLWPEFSKCILIGLMLIGACAGSTGGGIKVVRVILMAKLVRREIKKILRPRSVNVIKMDGRKVDEETISGMQSYLIMFSILLFGSVLIVSLDNFDFETTFSGVLATMNNIGPGFGAAGPAGSFSGFSDLSKLVMTLGMLLGRLEIFPIIMLFSPAVWRSKM